MDRALAHASRQPLAPAFLACLLGIALDAHCPLPVAAWLALFALGGWALGARPRFRAALPWLALPLAAAWHARCLRSYPADDIGNVAGERRITRLRGWLATSVIVERPPPADPLTWRQSPRASFRLDVAEIADGAGGWRAASGRIAVYVDAERVPLLPGDWIEAIGWFGAPSPPRNPGEFDSAAALARQRIRATFHCETAAAAAPLARPNALPLARFREELCEVARGRLRAALGANAPLAEAALLGDKAALRRDELEQYLTSGTLHLLVVSGWHIALAAWLATRIARCVVGAPALRAAVGLAAAWGYCWLTGNDPPAVRAAVVFSAFALADVLRRPAQPLNAGWAAGLALLAWDPMQVFQTGAQLSALAAGALVVFPWRLFPARCADDGLPLPWWRQPARSCAAALVASTAATLVAAPLVAARFHLFSPASIVLTVVLAPVLAVGISASAVLACLPGLPLVGPLSARLAAVCYWLVEALPRHSEAVPGSFCYLSGPPLWWCGAWFAVLYLPYMATGYRRTRWPHAAAALAWLAVGTAAQEAARRPRDYAFHQLAVGHGNCGVLRTPDGRTALVDCGSMAGPRIAERVVAPFLWADGVAGIDAVFLSHADSDHFNALPGLARRFRIGAVFAPPQFARLEQPAVAATCRELARLGVPVRFVWKGDVVRLGAASFAVDLPAAGDRGRNDNSVSLTARLECRGRSVLNTGDLAHEGLARLLAMPRRPCDVLVAPHHGSRTSNGPEFAAWTRPGAVVSSQGGFFRTDLTGYAALGAACFKTVEEGCVTIRWEGARLTATAFASGRRVVLP